MSDLVPVYKNRDNQQPIPTEWRETFASIVGAFVRDDFELKCGIPAVRLVSIQDALRFRESVEDYGVHLVALPAASWDTSCCQWMDGYWDVLIDLFSEEEGPSDLCLVARVHESAASYTFEIMGAYVP